MPQPSKKAQALAAEREILEKWIPADPSRPAYVAIRAEFIEKFPQLYLYLHETPSKRSLKKRPVSTEKVTKAASELKRLDKECMRLASHLFDRPNLWAAKDWRKPGIVKFLLRIIRRSSRPGRPETPQKELAEILALKARGLNNPQIADRLGLTREAVRKRLKAAEERRR